MLHLPERKRVRSIRPDRSSNELLRAGADDARRGAAHATRGVGRIINIGSVLAFCRCIWRALFRHQAAVEAIRITRPRASHERHPGLGHRTGYTKSIRRELHEPDAKVDEYREARAGMPKGAEVMATASRQTSWPTPAECDQAARPKVRYPRVALRRLRLLRRFAPAGVVDAGIRRTAARRPDAVAVSHLNMSGDGILPGAKLFTFVSS